MSDIGARILNIITESLYGQPEVVFREYVQNSIDAFRKDSTIDKSVYKSIIYIDGDDLYFLDNGSGIKKEEFLHEMSGIAISHKRQADDIGYKGIGRLSGISYCEKLQFVNICNFPRKEYQIYSIDCKKYAQIRKGESYAEMQFTELMKEIGKLENGDDKSSHSKVETILEKNSTVFSNRTTGFLVMMGSLSSLLKEVISKKNFLELLGWMLPVEYEEEIVSLENPQRNMKELLNFFKTDKEINNPLIEYEVSFNGTFIKRPILSNMLRDYVCLKRFGSFAVGFHSFSTDKFVISNPNRFKGIKIYIDNMLLCTEETLIPALMEYGFLKHTVNESLQTVRAVGAMIFIVDKINIVANARRSFIEVTDQDSLDFLKSLGEFVEQIYGARYALSKYRNAQEEVSVDSIKLNKLRIEAENKLKILANDEMPAMQILNKGNDDFREKTVSEQKRIMKKYIVMKINEDIKEYLNQTDEFGVERAYENFLFWIRVKYNG